MLKLGKPKAIKISNWGRDDAKVLDVASKNPVTCSTDQRVSDLLPVLSEKYRRLPVLDDHGNARGMVAATDVLKVLGGYGAYRNVKPADRPKARIKDIGMN